MENRNIGKEYELLAMNVYMGLLKEYPGVKVELRKKLFTKNKIPREIDIYAEIPVGPHIYKTAIECKDYKDKMGVEILDAFLGKLQGLDIDKGILVARGGYSEPAIKYAKEQGLDLIELRKPNEEDWKGRLKTIHIQMKMYYPEIYDIELKTDKPELVGRKMSGWANELFLIDETGASFKDLSKIIRESIKNEWDEKEKISSIVFEKQYFLKKEREKIPVKGISFRYRFHKIPEDIIIDGEKIVEFITKDAFTGEIRTIGKNFSISNKK